MKKIKYNREMNKLCLSVINNKLKAMQKRIHKLTNQMLELRQRDCERRWYLKQLKIKHQKNSHIIRKFKMFFKLTNQDMSQLKRLSERTKLFLKYSDGYKTQKRYIRYLTIDEKARLNYLLKRRKYEKGGKK